MSTTIRPDVVIIGSGVGGASIAYQLAGSSARVLVLERGDYLPNEPQNADAEAVFLQSRYRTTEEWQDPVGNRYHPGQYYFVGGHTRFYGTAMFRFRENDFKEVQLEDGSSPAWPIDYVDLEPYYGKAEQLFGVRGQASVDPTEPPRSSAYRHAPVPHEPVIEDLANRLSGMGLHPFHMPSAIDFGPGGTCQRCGTCDAFACRFDAKGDAEKRLLRPALAHDNVTLWTNSKVTRLIADGQHISGAEVMHKNERLLIEAPLFVLSAGAINSALILLRSATNTMPNGLANSSGVVGRNLMNHHLTGLMGIKPLTRNSTNFPKTLSVNDFYYGLPDDPLARGNIQMLGNIAGPMIRSTYPAMPAAAANWLGHHSVDMLVMSEDLPYPDSRVRLLEDERIEVDYRPGGTAAHDRFVRHTKRILKRAGFPLVLRHGFGITAPSHQCGTVRMGLDSNRSALDHLCRSYDHPNLYVVDASFFPSSAALNPALTISAQALRVGEHMRRQL